MAAVLPLPSQAPRMCRSDILAAYGLSQLQHANRTLQIAFQQHSQWVIWQFINPQNANVTNNGARLVKTVVQQFSGLWNANHKHGALTREEMITRGHEVLLVAIVKLCADAAGQSLNKNNVALVAGYLRRAIHNHFLRYIEHARFIDSKLQLIFVPPDEMGPDIVIAEDKDGIEIAEATAIRELLPMQGNYRAIFDAVRQYGYRPYHIVQELKLWSEQLYRSWHNKMLPWITAALLGWPLEIKKLFHDLSLPFPDDHRELFLNDKLHDKTEIYLQKIFQALEQLGSQQNIWRGKPTLAKNAFLEFYGGTALGLRNGTQTHQSLGAPLKNSITAIKDMLQ